MTETNPPNPPQTSPSNRLKGFGIAAMVIGIMLLPGALMFYFASSLQTTPIPGAAVFAGVQAFCGLLCILGGVLAMKRKPVGLGLAVFGLVLVVVNVIRMVPVLMSI